MDNDLIVINSGTLTQLSQAGVEGERRAYRCRFVQAGTLRAVGNRPAEISIDPAALQAAWAAQRFEGCAAFRDHAGRAETPSLRNLVGVTQETTWEAAEQAVYGVIRLYDTPPAQELASFLDELLADQLAGRATPDVGLSLVFWPEWEAGAASRADHRHVVSGVRQVESIDFVFGPAANGRVVARLGRERIDYIDEGGKDMCADLLNEGSSPAQEAREWLGALSETAASLLVTNSGLPVASRERLLQGRYDSPEAVRAAISSEQDYLARLAQDQVVQIGNLPPRGAQITFGRSGLEQVQLALEGLLNGLRPPEGIAPLTGVRELYHLLSGDYEMTGLFQPERVALANVNSSTLAALVANALNKVVANEFQQYPRWWEPFCTMQDFASLQAVKWITLGGIGELPTVAEGAAYTELTWDDKYESASFVKKGGYLGLTIEAIDKDDTGRLRAAPRALAQAAWLTLSKSVAGIFSANSGAGPTLSDGTVLFHSSRGNLGSSALSWSAYAAARLAMRKQSELNSGERLGALTAARYLLVPPDLEITALQLLASEGQPGTADHDANPLAEGDTFEARLRAARNRVVVVDLWCDANDWACVADPRLYPSIGLGFRYGRAPEVFSVASPTAGLMFTNDTMPVKVRFFFAVGPVDYRGMWKANV